MALDNAQSTGFKLASRVTVARLPVESLDQLLQVRHLRVQIAGIPVRFHADLVVGSHQDPSKGLDPRAYTSDPVHGNYRRDLSDTLAVLDDDQSGTLAWKMDGKMNVEISAQEAKDLQDYMDTQVAEVIHIGFGTKELIQLTEYLDTGFCLGFSYWHFNACADKIIAWRSARA